MRWLFSLTVLVARGDRGEERRAARAPARERGAAAERRPDTVRTRRPGLVRRAHPVHPEAALGRSLPRDARDAARLAPQARRQEIRHQQAAPARPPAVRALLATPGRCRREQCRTAPGHSRAEGPPHPPVAGISGETTLAAQIAECLAPQQAATVPLLLAFYYIVGGDSPLCGKSSSHGATRAWPTPGRRAVWRGSYGGSGGPA
jgi:hypothetical protein